MKRAEVTDRQTVTEPGSNFEFCFSIMQIQNFIVTILTRKLKNKSFVQYCSQTTDV